MDECEPDETDVRMFDNYILQKAEGLANVRIFIEKSAHLEGSLRVHALRSVCLPLFAFSSSFVGQEAAVD
jgi:hypothetical protein